MRQATGMASPHSRDVDPWMALRAQIEGCRACPRLVAWREEVARRRRVAYQDQEYWGRPVPGFGDRDARLLLVGLAPAAHGGNRTGRVFTGDRSGDWLFAALHRAGYANRPRSVSRDDGLILRDAYVTAAVRCAPPQNRPTPDEQARCRPYLERELRLLRRLRVVVALGGLAWQATWRALDATGLATVPRPRPRFAHGAEVPAGRLTVVGCYHPSQQNTFTGRLTDAMGDEILRRVRRLCSVQE